MDLRRIAFSERGLDDVGDLLLPALESHPLVLALRDRDHGSHPAAIQQAVRAAVLELAQRTGTERIAVLEHIFGIDPESHGQDATTRRDLARLSSHRSTTAFERKDRGRPSFLSLCLRSLADTIDELGGDIHRDPLPAAGPPLSPETRAIARDAFEWGVRVNHLHTTWTIANGHIDHVLDVELEALQDDVRVWPRMFRWSGSGRPVVVAAEDPDPRVLADDATVRLLNPGDEPIEEAGVYLWFLYLGRLTKGDTQRVRLTERMDDPERAAHPTYGWPIRGVHSAGPRALSLTARMPPACSRQGIDFIRASLKDGSAEVVARWRPGDGVQTSDLAPDISVRFESPHLVCRWAIEEPVDWHRYEIRYARPKGDPVSDAFYNSPDYLGPLG